MTKRSEFKLIRDCQKLYKEICATQATSDKNYRYTICADLRRLSSNLIHVVRKANDLRAGTKERIELQENALEILERIKDIAPVVGELIKMGVAREAQIELSVDNIRLPLRRWMEYDQRLQVKTMASFLQEKEAALSLAKQDLQLLEEFSRDHNEQRINDALTEARARVRILESEHRVAIEGYDRALSRHQETRRRIGVQGNLLDEVLRDIKRKITDPAGEITYILNGSS